MTDGKMLRGLLIIRLGLALGTCRTRLIACAAAVELAHLASLLHDDIVDGDCIRRGRPALWTLRGPKYAVLAGGLLVARAIRLIRRSAPEMISDFSETLAQMCEGEFMEQNIRKPSRRQLRQIAERKTGSLFGFSARCATVDEGKLRLMLARAGMALGTAYQIADDARDARIASSARRKAARRAVTMRIRQCREMLRRWPRVRNALNAYLRRDFLPAIDSGH